MSQLHCYPRMFLRPLEQCLLWSTSAKRHWMTSLPGIRWAYIGSLDMLEYEVMKSPMGSRGVALLWGFFDPSQPWESRWGIQKRLSRWLVSQHGAQWHGLGDTQRQAWEFILGPILGTRAKFFTFNRTQSRAVTGLMGHKHPEEISLPTRTARQSIVQEVRG